MFLSIAVHSETVEEYKQTESSYRIVLVGDRVDLVCSANTSRPLKWHFNHRMNEREAINDSSQAGSNVADLYRIVSEDVGRATLIIDRVLLKHAGRYECHAIDKTYKLIVDVTVFGKDIIFTTSVNN